MKTDSDQNRPEHARRVTITSTCLATPPWMRSTCLAGENGGWCPIECVASNKPPSAQQGAVEREGDGPSSKQSICGRITLPTDMRRKACHLPSRQRRICSGRMAWIREQLGMGASQSICGASRC